MKEEIKFNSFPDVNKKNKKSNKLVIFILILVFTLLLLLSSYLNLKYIS